MQNMTEKRICFSLHLDPEEMELTFCYRKFLLEIRFEEKSKITRSNMEANFRTSL